MERHYLSRQMRNTPTSIALCGYRFSPQELDWSRRRQTYTYFPNQVICDSCRAAISALVPKVHWEKRVEIHEPSHGRGYNYTVFYPYYMIMGEADASEVKLLSPAPERPYPSGPPENPDLPYLEFQNIFDILKLLAKTAKDPWKTNGRDLRPEQAPLLHQVGKRLERTAANEADSDFRDQLNQAAKQLNSLHSATQAKQEVSLTSGQIESYNLVWDSLEAIRREKAMSLHDVAAPIVDDPLFAESTAEKDYAVAS